MVNHKPRGCLSPYNIQWTGDEQQKKFSTRRNCVDITQYSHDFISPMARIKAQVKMCKQALYLFFLLLLLLLLFLFAKIYSLPSVENYSVRNVNHFVTCL